MSEYTFLRAFREFVHQHNLIERGEKIIAAVSGGIDSMVLLDVLCQYKEEWQLEIVVAHFNHQLRGKESDEDEQFVSSEARRRGLVCYIEQANTQTAAETSKRSIQEIARQLRYEFFGKLKRSMGIQKIATAHHADDNAETILFNLFRGAGVNGLSGIPVMRKDETIIRPLLFATRKEITLYATEHEIRYREDSTNAQTDYTRNFLRHEIIPRIEKNINPNLVLTLRRAGEIFHTLEEYLVAETAKVSPDVVVRRSSNEIVLDLTKLKSLPPFLHEYLLMQTAKEFTNSDIDFATVRTMIQISGGETGSSCLLTKEVVLYRDRNNLIFKRILKGAPFQYLVEPRQQYNFEQFYFGSASVADAIMNGDPSVEFVDADRLREKLVLRSWRKGDWFIPLGMKDKKKLSDFFIEQKIPLFEKQTIPVLESDGEIVWVCGKRLDDRFKINSDTKHVLKLEYSPHS